MKEQAEMRGNCAQKPSKISKFGHFLATARENRLPHRKTVVISNRGVGKFMKKSSFLSGTTYKPECMATFKQANHEINSC
ncbi:MAG: hypothetical protein PHH11_09850 [Methylomonas sp.]|nr:hypothetical protein [Methylomonas sp.]